jgi:hypothetical protein
LGKWFNEENLISEPLRPELREEPADPPRRQTDPEHPG